MVKKGVSKLPIGVSTSQALKILEKLPAISRKIGALEERFRSPLVSTHLIQLLSLNESVESTRIEGTQVTFTDMVEEMHDTKPRKEIIEVMNYHHALMEGYHQISIGYPISTRMIKDLHKILMKDERGAKQTAGDYRTIQNFIGPSNEIEEASYIPVSAGEIESFMNNLELFINGHPYGEVLSREHISSNSYCFDENADELIKTTIIHAQFESIHPFLDGNGRLGRILIVLHLIQSKMISKPTFFVSEELEKEKARYYNMLNATRGDNPEWGDWILFFIQASERMADQLNHKLYQAEKLAEDGLKKCKTNSEKTMWLYTFQDPFTTVKEASAQTKLSANAARNALNRLVEEELLFTEKDVKRNKKYRNYDLMRILRN
ncbi:Fic family protein [Oceanobacillus oncorhynchi subsp. oncorhynchi]|uniref:Fic family protein n=1 Tax=Oceanobacillus oncorhynchi TaxID=545501 RepID=UPI00363AA9CB